MISGKMNEKPVRIESKDALIEGLLARGSAPEAVVVTHPHPLYGGDMRSGVVEAAVRAYHRRGYTTLRFNFRGVGRSTGRYAQGLGEQEDVLGALAFLTGKGASALDLVGYSFGAWVNARGLERFVGVRRLILVSPPVDLLDFSGIVHSSKIELVITGSRDDIAPPDRVREMMDTWNPNAVFRIVSSADHFYGGKTGKVEEIIEDFLEPAGGG